MWTKQDLFELVLALYGEPLERLKTSFGTRAIIPLVALSTWHMESLYLNAGPRNVKKGMTHQELVRALLGVYGQASYAIAASETVEDTTLAKLLPFDLYDSNVNEFITKICCIPLWLPRPSTRDKIAYIRRYIASNLSAEDASLFVEKFQMLSNELLDKIGTKVRAPAELSKKDKAQYIVDALLQNQ